MKPKMLFSIVFVSLLAVTIAPAHGHSKRNPTNSTVASQTQTIPTSTLQSIQHEIVNQREASSIKGSNPDAKPVAEKLSINPLKPVKTSWKITKWIFKIIIGIVAIAIIGGLIYCFCRR